MSSRPESSRIGGNCALQHLQHSGTVNAMKKGYLNRPNVAVNDKQRRGSITDKEEYCRCSSDNSSRSNLDGRGSSDSRSSFRTSESSTSSIGSTLFNCTSLQHRGKTVNIVERAIPPSATMAIAPVYPGGNEPFVSNRLIYRADYYKCPDSLEVPLDRQARIQEGDKIRWVELTPDPCTYNKAAVRTFVSNHLLKGQVQQSDDSSMNKMFAVHSKYNTMRGKDVDNRQSKRFSRRRRGVNREANLCYCPCRRCFSSRLVREQRLQSHRQH